MAKKQSRFAGKVSSDAQRQKNQGASYGHLLLPRGVRVFKETPGGRVTLDVIPYIVSSDKHIDRNAELGIAVPGEPWYKRPYYLHRNINNESYVCLSSIGKKCPICEYRAKMIKEGAPKEETGALKPSLRNLYVIVPIGAKDFEEEMHIWDISQAMFQQMLNNELEENPENEVFPDPESGKSLRIRFESKTIGKSKPFAEANRIDFVDREETYDEGIIEKAPDLDTIIKILSYKELEAIFLELDEVDVVDVDDDEPVRKPLKKKEEDDNEGEDDVKPTRLRKAKEVVVDDEDDPPVRTSLKKKAVEEDVPLTRKRPGAKVEGADLKPASVAKEKNKCPSGFRFGVDTEQFDECDSCSIWDACIDEKEG